VLAKVGVIGHPMTEPRAVMPPAPKLKGLRR
jgi:hypothetical protein